MGGPSVQVPDAIACRYHHLHYRTLCSDNNHLQTLGTAVPTRTLALTFAR